MRGPAAPSVSKREKAQAVADGGPIGGETLVGEGIARREEADGLVAAQPGGQLFAESEGAMRARGDDEQGRLRLTGEGGDEAGLGAIGEADGRGRRGDGEGLSAARRRGRLR